MTQVSKSKVVSTAAGAAANGGAKLVQVARHTAANPVFEWLARIGSAAVGAGYILVGILAAISATGGSAHSPNQQGALDVVYQHPFGRFILGATAICIFAYAIFRGVRAFMAYGKLSSRIASFARGVAYAILAYGAIRLAISGHQTGTGTDQNFHRSTAKLLQMPFGREFVVLIGIVVIAIGLYQLYKAYASKIDRILALSQLSETARRGIIILGRFGLAARGVIFALIGAFLMIAGINNNPNRSRGMAGALHSLQNHPYGPPILGCIAAGFVAYGIYALAQARYRDFSPSSLNND